MQDFTTAPQQWFTARAQQQQTTGKVSQLVTLLVRQAHCDPDRLLGIMQQQGVPVYRIEQGVIAASAILNQLGYQPGFIPASDTWQYRMLRDGLNALYGEQAPETSSTACGLVVLPEKMVSIGFVAYTLHHWIACAQGLPGYEPEAQRLFTTNWEKTDGQLPDEVSALPELALRRLQQAIQREAEALICLRDIQTLVIAPARQAHALRYGQATA